MLANFIMASTRHPTLSLCVFVVILGEVFGGWLHGIRSVLPEYAKEVKKTLLFSSAPTDHPELLLPGHLMLAHLLPSHLSSSQPVLLMIAMLLGVHVTEVIIINLNFDGRTLS